MILNECLYNLCTYCVFKDEAINKKLQNNPVISKEQIQINNFVNENTDIMKVSYQIRVVFVDRHLIFGVLI